MVCRGFVYSFTHSLCIYRVLGELIQDLFARQELSCNPSVVPCLPLHRDFFFFNAPGAECWKHARPTLEARSSGPGPCLNTHIPWLSLAPLTLGLHPSSFNYKEVVKWPRSGRLLTLADQCSLALLSVLVWRTSSADQAYHGHIASLLFSPFRSQDSLPALV